MQKPVPTSLPLAPDIRERWSQYAFDPAAVLSRGEYEVLVEAARWAPSSSNLQPWRFIAGLNRDEVHAKLASCLDEGNRLWAPAASLLVCCCAFLPHPRLAGENPWARHDLGVSVGFLLLQSVHMGLACHPMGGFSASRVRELFGLGPEIEPLSMVAVGRPGDPGKLAPAVGKKQSAPRTRREPAEILLF
jgi:nitroreductase